MNAIIDIKGINQLKNLKHLSVVGKTIWNLIYIIGNQLKAIKDVECLKGCTTLSTIYLQTITLHDHNPVCKELQYRDKVFKTLPNLSRLDGVQKGLDYAGFEAPPDIKKLEIGDLKPLRDDPWYGDMRALKDN